MSNKKICYSLDVCYRCKKEIIDNDPFVIKRFIAHDNPKVSSRICEECYRRGVGNARVEK